MKEQILSKLSDAYPWADQFQFFDSIASTNTHLKALAKEGAPYGTVLVADHQTGGRGRLGRTFLSPSGVGIYMSMLLRPNCLPGELMHLTCAAAVAMCDAVEQAAGFRPGIKWTNDLVFNHRKLAGILTELGLNPDGSVDFAVIGIGINCCQKKDDFPPEIQSFAGSLEMISGKPIDRSLVAASMMEALWKMSTQLLTHKADLMEQYRRDCITVGQQISLVRGDTTRHGTALNVDNDGALVVKFDRGQIEVVSSGEISIRGMYGYV